MTPVERTARRLAALDRAWDRLAGEADADIPQPARALVWNRIERVTRCMKAERRRLIDAPARRLQDVQRKARIALDWLDPSGGDDDALMVSLCRDVLAMKGGNDELLRSKHNSIPCLRAMCEWAISPHSARCV